MVNKTTQPQHELKNYIILKAGVGSRLMDWQPILMSAPTFPPGSHRRHRRWVSAITSTTRHRGTSTPASPSTARTARCPPPASAGSRPRSAGPCHRPQTQPPWVTWHERVEGEAGGGGVKSITTATSAHQRGRKDPTPKARHPIIKANRHTIRGSTSKHNQTQRTRGRWGSGQPGSGE